MIADDDLYRHSIDTLLAYWEENARGAVDPRLSRLPGVAVALFPAEPERSFYNNAVLDTGLDAAMQAAALDATEQAYVQAAIVGYAAWVHESDHAMIGELAARGYTPTSSTRAMGMSLQDLAVDRPAIDIGVDAWSEHLRIIDVPGLYSQASPTAFHILTARLDGQNAATALAFDWNHDCGIFNVATLEPARRRGLGSALTARLLHDAIQRGCRTASLQSTEVAEGVYASIGFRDLGRILEYTR